jgi:hypothetical protein
MRQTGTGGGGGGAAAAANEDYTRVDVTDGTWTLADTNSVASSITNVGGINKCSLSTYNAGDIVDGAVWYKEVLTGDGSSMDFADKGVLFQGYVHMPGVGFATSDGATGGGDNRPPVATQVFCVMGLMSDPTNIPVPADVLGCGLNTKSLGYRMYSQRVFNTSTSSPTGAISTSTSALESISEADVAAGDRSSNRIGFHFIIERNEVSSSSGINIANNPVSRWLIFRDRLDDGDARGSLQSLLVNQKWGRSANVCTKLYVFVAVGHGSSVANPHDIDFDCYYNVTHLDGGLNPSGRTGLT